MIDTPVEISRIHYPISTLGPGRRIGIWFQGCSIRCQGCVSVDTWKKGNGKTTIETLIKKISSWLPQADGITISGGEPFDQFPGLQILLTAVKEQWTGDILVYSGYEFEQIKTQVMTLAGKIDALISGPFVAGEKQTLPLRGSDNQQLHCLTERGHERFSGFHFPQQQAHKTLDIMFDEHGVAWMAGIPQQKDMHLLKTLLQQQGHQIEVSEQPELIKIKAGNP